MLLSAITILLLAALCHAQQCYFPNGDPADEYAPCSTDNQNCCYYTGLEFDDACFSNGLCFSWMLGYTYRGACTDKKWGDGCAQVCTEGE